MESDQRTGFIRLYLASIRGDLSRLEDLAADSENNRPVAVATTVREAIDSILLAVMKLEHHHGI